ncbi:white-opaque regulator 1 [Echria macrotheca]|uniref:White-opaque regulator 1 n=1 Tax=Echria macrotheca TaxID=438768 RepID=A0AAJ0F5W8_9PEZI|nr:white-opaque regulator 1 [Echria macrotheca]
MFRDESTKVIQKAHAQWGVQGPPSDSSEASGSSPPSISPSGTSGRSRTSIAESTGSSSPVSSEESRLAAPRVPLEITTTSVDRAVQFYLEHYVIGLPDEAKSGYELQQHRWVFAPTTRQVMAAVGLAGLSNIAGDKDTMLMARQQYGIALRDTAMALQNFQHHDVDITLRAVVMLGMFEIVRGDDQPTKGAQTHIMGGAALMRSVLPFFQSSPDGLRGLVQICYSMVATVMCSVQQLSPEPNVMIPTEPVPSMAQGILPPAFFDWIHLGSSTAVPEDVPAVQLIAIIARFVQLAALIRSRLLKDGRSETLDILKQALEIERELDEWETRQQDPWLFREERVGGNFFPPDAVFEGCYHVYTDMWTARVWTNYRFARILVNQLLVEAIERFPTTAPSLLSADQQRRSLDVIRRVARDTLVSTPTHYRHPRLERRHRELVEKTSGGAEIGAVQIPTLLFQLKVAAAAPGVPHSYYVWAREMLRTVFADTGMLQARRLGDILEKARPASPPAFIKLEDL